MLVGSFIVEFNTDRLVNSVDSTSYSQLSQLTLDTIVRRSFHLMSRTERCSKIR